MKFRLKASLLIALVSTSFSTVLFNGTVCGEDSNSSQVKRAGYSQPVPANSPQQITFSRQSTQVGDEVEQTLGLDVKLKMTMRQANEVVGTNNTTVRTNQRRVLTTTKVENGRTAAIRVQYPVATKQEAIVEASESKSEPQLNAQPVQGKTYLCRRDSSDNSELIVTDEAGNRPPTEEYEIVAQQMQMVGRQNPLAQFLAGRTIAVGEKVELPNSVASQIFNLGDKFGKVARFTLTLQKVKTEDGATRAVFQSNVDAVANGVTQMRMEMEGPLEVDVATCRAQTMSLVGPIGMSETRGSYSTAYQMIGTGKLQMSIASTYRDAKR